MQIKITVVKDNGEELSYLRQLGELDSLTIVNSVAREVVALQRDFSPFLSERLIEAHQQGFVGEKNQEEKWDTRGCGVWTTRGISNKESKIYP